MSKDKKRKFKKGGVSRNAQKQVQGSQYGYLNLPKGLSMFKEEPKSRVDLDIMPYEVTSQSHPDRDDEYGIAQPGSLWYKFPFLVHRNIGSDNTAVICPTTLKKKCPICEYRAQLMKDGAAWDEDSVKALKPSLRNLYSIIPKGSKKYEEKPHIWDISQFLFQNKLNEEIGENEKYETFPDLEDGYTLRIRFSEGSFGTNKFADTSRIDFVDRKPYDEDILDKIPSLDELLEIKSYKELSALFFGNLSEDEVKDDDEHEYEGDRDNSSDNDDEPDDDDKKDDYKEDHEKPPENPAKARERRRQEKAVAGKKENPCPNDHEFGKDCDEYDECEKCDKWDDCFDATK